MIKAVLFLLGLFCGSVVCKIKPNNVCKTFDDYYRIDSSENCWYNPDVEDDIVSLNFNNLSLMENKSLKGLYLFNPFSASIFYKTTLVRRQY